MSISNPRIEIPVPAGKQYAPFQVKAIKYALGAKGTLIADEMGLGKTVEAIGVINALRAMHVVVVTPAGLILNWKNELDDWVVPVPGQHIQVVSYQKAEQLQLPTPIDLLIIDEAHYCKNPLSQRSELMRVLSAQAKRVLALTGTPMENCPIELWPILRMVCPEKWDPPNPRIGLILSPEQKKTHPGEGPNFWAYAKRYCGLRKVVYTSGGKQRKAWDFSGASNLDELRKKLRATCMVRRLKSDVLTELPEKRRQLIVLPSKGDDLFPSEITEQNYFDVLWKLKADKALFSEWSKKRHEQALAKVDDCIRIIGDQLDEVQKVIVFAHHKDVIAKLAVGLDCEVSGTGYCVTVTGETKLSDRQAAIEKFQNDPSCRVFIGSIGAAGVGYTLTAASHVIFVELDPVPGRMTQAEDRAHRISQRNMVMVYHLLANNSLCARIARILVKKQDVITRALDGNSQSQDWTKDESFFPG